MGVNRLDRDIDDMDPQPFDPLAAHAIRPCCPFASPQRKEICLTSCASGIRVAASAPLKKVPASPFVMAPIRCLLKPAAPVFDSTAARCV
jgi:hypothetical protein